MCNELFWEVEQKLIMHKLAKDYYGFRAYWLQCLPLLLMTTFITIITLTEYGHIHIGIVDDEEYLAERGWLVLSVGILGLLSTILTSLLITSRCQSQHDMHAMSERMLQKVCQTVRFPQRQPGDNSRNSMMEHINTQKAIFVAISCTSCTIPTRMIQTFRELEHAMALKPYTFRAIQYERFYYALWKLFTTRWCLWPYIIPQINVWPCIIPQINLSTSGIGVMIDDEFSTYNKGLEEANKTSALMTGRRKSRRKSRRNSPEDEGTCVTVTSSTIATEV